MALEKKLVILGSGPAGLTAAIYAARANLKPLVINGAQPGGQLTITTEVENFPGFPDGVLGPTLMEDMEKQAKKFGTEFLVDSVESVNLKPEGEKNSEFPFVLNTSSDEVHCSSLIICTGASAKFLGLESEQKLVGRGVSTCATCDGFFFKNKKVFVIGGGDAAMEEAIVLSRLASEVKVVHRRDEFRASSIMVERAKANKKIEFVLNSAVESIGDTEAKKVKWIELRNLKDDKVTRHDADGIFIAIGHSPNTKLFKGQLELDDLSYIKVDGVKTNISGVFAAGDVADRRYRQAITAAGMGCAAALEAQWHLES
ncbi:MAG: thioredoxin-disulfide reductase [Cyanobacteria bacterium]|nr:thioredoxin-disulfide reductase [Cyanobacteriota bacterium]